MEFVNMQRFWWPGYEMQLLEQLQRQQNSTQFCDTLLQTEGISVPTHSCVLAALSPYFSQRLSESPSPPLGQKRRLHLQEVTAQTLLKLVGVLYSGELEVKSSKEQKDVLAAAHRFGISDLVLGCRDGERRGVELLERRQKVHMGEGTELRKSLKMQDAQVQTEMSGKTDNGPLVKRKSFGTQTVINSLSVASPGLLSDQTPPPTIERASSVATFSASLQPQNFPQFSLTPYSIIHSDPESTAGQSSDCLTHPSFSSASSSYTGTLQAFLSDDASSPRSHEKNISKHLSESGEGVSEQERLGQEDRNVDGGNSAQQGGVCRERIRGEEKEKRNSRFIRRGKNLEKMKEIEQMMDSAQISVKVKLRRRTKGQMWEIVEDADETASVLTPLNQSCSNQITPQEGLEVVQTPAHSVLPDQNPDFQKVQQVFTSSPQLPKHGNTSSDSDARSNGWLSMSQSSELGSESLSPPRGPVEESDEKMDRLLDNIIMSMSLLPDLGRNCKKTHRNHDGAPTFCLAPATENGAGPTPLPADVCAAECDFYPHLERQGGLSITDTGIHYCFGAQNQPNYQDPSTVLAGLQTQQQQPSEFSSSIRCFGQMNGLSWAGGENSPYPVTCFSSGQKLHDLVLQQPLPQEDQSIEFLSLSHESETQSADEFSLPGMDDLRLPQCLSPLEPCPSAAQQQPDPNISGQPPVKTLYWLGETACTLQFPLNAITAGKRASQLPATSSSAEKSKSQRCMKLKAKNGAEAGSAKSVEERETKSKPERKSDPMKRKKNKHDAAEDAAPPKRRRRRCPDSRKESKVLALDSISLEARNAARTICSVSLSYKNVLIKERGETISSLNKPRTAPTAAGSEKSKEAADLGTEQTRVKTRGFVKRCQRNTSSTISDKCCVLIPVIRRAAVVQKQDPAPPKRKRGRPPKIKLEQKLPEDVGANAEIRDDKEDGEKQPEKEAPMEDIKCQKLVSSASEEEAGQLRRTMSAEHSGKNEMDYLKSTETQKQSWMVTLKEFQKLIKRKHSKTRKGTEVQDRNKSVDVGDFKRAAKESYGGAKIQRQPLLDAPVDENHSLLPNTSAAPCEPTQQDVRGSSETRKSSVLGHEDQPASSCDVLEDEKAMLLSEREQTATSPDQGADRSSNLSGYNGKEEDEEVDVMLYSPDKWSSARELEERVVVIPDEEEEEEEEEDVDEIDVIGDEAE